MTKNEQEFMLKAMDEYDKMHKTDYARLFTKSIIDNKKIETKRFQIIGHKRTKNGDVLIYDLGAYNHFANACARAKRNARGGWLDRQFIFDNINGYYVKINAGGWRSEIYFDLGR